MTVGASRRIDGATGEVWMDIGGSMEMAADIVEINGAIRKERKDVPIPGTRNTHHKSGRITREGSFRFQKIDDRYESYFLSQLQDLATLRALRDANGGNLPNNTFSVLINLDDPQAWGASTMLITGVEMWELPIGFNLNDLIEREIPITWENEIPQRTLDRTGRVS